MLSADDLGLVRVLAVLAVVALPVQEQHKVGVLLHVATVAQVREHWALVAALFDLAVQLAQDDGPDVELSGQPLEPSADVADGLVSLAAVLEAHQAEVVHADGAQLGSLAGHLHL
uniref:DNA helicase n=1 Tax=uncultured marine virus TaxID=186617 RepID=A0A0F7L3B1_9VIRU|nr:DNA helicase [uncultured marine virus]